MLRYILSVVIFWSSRCQGFQESQNSKLHRPPFQRRTLATSIRSFEHKSRGDDDDESKTGLTPACRHSETFNCTNEHLTVDGQRILYRNGRVENGQWVPGNTDVRPTPFLFNLSSCLLCTNNNNNSFVIDKNGYPWRAEHVLSNQGLRRNNMEATERLYRDLNEQERQAAAANTTTIRMPIPWHGPFNLPAAERGMGSNRKLRDDESSYGHNILDDERWLVYYMKLAAFLARYGHTNVPLNYEFDPSLSRWVLKQRVLYQRLVQNSHYQYEIRRNNQFGRKVNPLSPWRIQMLYDIGFSFKIKLRWRDRYEQLREFRTRHGNTTNTTAMEQQYPGLSLWMQTQRTEYRKMKSGLESSMTRSRFLALDALHMDWDPIASQWERRIDQLNDYTERYGDANVKKTHDLELAIWLRYQRQQYRIYQETPWDSTLTSDKIAQLEELGVVWDPIESQWQGQFEKLRSFQAQHGHTNVPVEYDDDPTLSLWVQKQRRKYREGDLSTERKEQLRSVGFVFDLYDDAFSRGLRKLKAYRTEHGHCRVPRSHPDAELVSFVVQQRSQYRQLQTGQSSSLTERRMQSLEELGFEWFVRKNDWEKNFAKLRQFHATHGHANVPSNCKDQSLYRFVSMQRTLYRRVQSGKSQVLSPERIRRLEAINFVWNTNEARWMERYEELKAFRDKYGHANVPDGYSANLSLATWVRNQRVRKSKMTAKRIALLKKAGFQFNVREVSRDGAR